MVKTQESLLVKSSKTPAMENTTIKTQNNFTLLEEEQMVLGETIVFVKNKNNNNKNTNLINKVFLNTNNPLETSLGSMDISNSHVAMVNTKVPNAMQENYTKNIISTTNTKARDSMTVNSTQSKDQYTTNDSITPVATNIMTVIACGNEEFEHAIQMSTPSTHYGQMASEPKNSIQAKSEKDIAQYNTPLHTLDMQMICQSLAHIPTLLLKIKKPRPKILL